MPDTFSGGQNIGSIEPVDANPTPQSDPANYADVIEAEALAKELALRPFTKVFGDIGELEKPKLDYIVAAIKGDDKKMETEEVVSRIRQLEKKLGVSWHQSLLERVYRHVKMVSALHDSMLGGL